MAPQPPPAPAPLAPRPAAVATPNPPLGGNSPGAAPGWVVPTATGQPVAPPQQATNSTRWVWWVVLVGGALVTLGGCCLGLMLLGGNQQ